MLHKATLAIALFALAALVQSDDTTVYFDGSTPAPTPFQRTWQKACGDNVKGLWLDVFFLIDSSAAMTQMGFDAAINYVITAMYPTPIGLDDGQFTRVGIITYSKNASLAYGLTDITDRNVLFDMKVNYDGEDGTNLEAGIQLASQQFSQANGHRNNVRAVLVILASSYQKGAYSDPSAVAFSFRESVGTIISIEYVQKHGLSVPEVAKLATPGFNLTNTNLDLTAKEVQDLFCIANCYCPTNYLPMGDDSQIYDVPYGGCYWQVTIPALQPLAERYCVNIGSGTLAVIEDDSKWQFLKTVFPSPTNFWVGLQLTGGSWVFDDGSVWPTSSNYWAPGEPSGSGTCAYMKRISGFTYGLVADDCMDSLNYVCQENNACSVNRYCNTTDSAVFAPRNHLRAYRLNEN